MLILTRKKNETICIGNQIELTILEVNGEQIKIGIEAPRDIDIHRKEVLEKIKLENQKALDTTDQLLTKMNIFKKK